MEDREWLAGQFESLRPRLQSVAYSILGSVSDAEDAVQECWLRLDRSDASNVADLQGWLTTVVGRICLDMLRRRRHRAESQLGDWLPEPIVDTEHGDPEQEALVADSVGLALLVVLETLTPAERLAFVLHDVFGVPFDEIAPVVDRTPEAARQLAARARRRVQAAPTPDSDLAVQRKVVAAFLTAARAGDMRGLLEVLAPDVVFRADLGVGGAGPTFPVVGAQAVVERVLQTAPRFAPHATPAIVNGQAGAVFAPDGRAVGVIGFTVVNGLIVA
ncbi:MAG TPA: RNA polymerase sigma factor SigJ, partial [Mycobacteriales bacterium]|nr:RNA polymerase sigma factor SigJ [Mycobacteriales bacterium]